jgi:hypothetical protein
MADIGRALRFSLVGLALLALPTQAAAGGVSGVVIFGGGGNHVTATPGSGGGGDVSALIPTVTPMSNAAPASAILPFTMGNSFTAPSANADSPSDRSGLDEKWGDPLNTKLFDSDTVHAGLNYYYGSGLGGTQGGVGFSLHIDN